MHLMATGDAQVDITGRPNDDCSGRSIYTRALVSETCSAMGSMPLGRETLD